MNEAEDNHLHLCCCEYIDIDNERNHILACCCNCVDLDICVDRLLRCKEVPKRTIKRVATSIEDRMRLPWRGGARKLNIDSVIPILLLPSLGYIAAQGVLISVLVFLTLPIILICIHYVSMKTASRTKFFFIWTITSVAIIVLVFEFPVVITLEIRSSEQGAFLMLTLLMVLCGVKVRLTVEHSLVKTEAQADDSHLECAVCHKSVSPRTFHCSICRSCIVKRDLHCAWLDCCIGESNHRWYMATLLSAICQLALCSNLILTTACHPFSVFASIMLPDDCSDVYFDILYATTFVTALYAILAMVFLITMLLHECWLISLGMTGTEWRNLPVKVWWGIYSKRPYSKGFIKNWAEFFLGPKNKDMAALTI